MERIFITPLAKKIALINKVDLSSLKGSGPRGRVIKSDIEKIIKNKEVKVLGESEKQR